MKKIIRLTESELIETIENFVDKIEVNEQGMRSLLKTLLKKSSKSSSKMGLPLIHQLPSKVQMLIRSFPQNVKVGDKLKEIFDTHATDIKSLEGNLKRQGIEGGSDIYSESLSKAISTPKGGVVNLQDVYSNSQLLKKTLENIKSSIPVPKQGNLLKKNPNYSKEMTDLYNKFYTETSSLNRFISDLEKIKNVYKPR
jgi:Skp family chaperone for outer membrane proteins